MKARHHLAATLALSWCMSALADAQATTGWNQTAGGTYDYNSTDNWVGGNINGIWDPSLSLVAAQTITFDSNLVLSTGLNFGYTGNHSLTLRGDGTDRTITLGGDIAVAPVSNQTVTIGSLTANQGLNVNLGGDRTFTVSANKTLRFYNAITGGNLTLSGNNSSTVGGGSVILSGDSATAASSALNLTRGALLTFDSSGSGSVGAIRVQSLQLSGGGLAINGNAGSNTTETISGALTIAPGHSYNSVTLTPNAGTHLQLNAASLSRSGTGAVLFRGTNLGVNSIASATAGSANIAFSTAPTAQLVGGALGTKGASILPWGVVDTSATGLGSSFATYDATNGIRALNASEYSTTIATDGSTDGHNIKLTSTGTALTVNGATTVNSLFIDHNTQGAGTALTGTGSLTVTSGAVFFNIASMTGGNPVTLDVAKNLNFGATQGVIGTSSSSNQRRITFSGGISGSGGIVFYDTGLNTNQATGFYLGHANTYTGDTHINGTVSVPVNNALPNFSNNSRTGDVVLNGVLKLITTNGTIQINGLRGNGTVFSQYTNSNKTLAVGDNNATSTFDGSIVNEGNSGSINLRKIGTGTLTLTGTNNTYTGVTSVQNGTLSAVTLNNVAAPNATSTLGRPTTAAAGTIALGATTTTGNLRVTGTGETTDRVINLAGTTGGGGIEQAGTGHLEFTSDFTATGGGDKTLTLSGSTAGTGEISGAIVNNSVSNETALTKSGTGTWILSGDNTYTGATNVTAGTLVVNGSLANTSTVTVASNGTLKGDGTIGGATSILGTFAPGNSIGTLTFLQTLSLAGVSDFEIDPTLGLGLNSDLADVAGTVTYGGTLNVLYGGSASDFSAGMAFKLFDAAVYQGSFGTLNLPDLGSTGLSWQDNLLSDGTLVVIPETGAALLGAFGMLTLLRRRR